VIKLILEERGELQEMQLERDAITVGRTADNAIRVQDALSSRHHCRIEKTADGWTVEDLKSRNGTTLNGQRLEGRKILAIGDRIAIGESIVHFGAKMQEASKSAPPKVKSQKIVKPTTIRKTRYVLKGTEGVARDKSFAIAAFPFTVGRKKGCGLLLDDDDVAPEHCMLVEDQGTVHVVDLNSAAGTFVSGKRVKGRERLEPNAILALGTRVKLRFKDSTVRTGIDSDDAIEPVSSKSSDRTASPDAGTAPAPARVEEVHDLSKLGEEEDPASTPSRAQPRPASKPAAGTAPVAEAPPRQKTARRPSPVSVPEPGSDLAPLADETGIAQTDLSAAAIEQGESGGAGAAIVLLLVILGIGATAFPIVHTFLGHEDRDPEPEENIVKNWSFEQKDPLKGWKIDGPGGVVTDGVIYGARAVKLEARSKTERGELRSRSGETGEATRLREGHALALHAAVKTQGAAACVLGIEWTDEKAPDWKELATAAIVENASAWTDAGGSLVPPSRATHARAVAIALPLGTASGTVFVDRVSLREEPLPTSTVALQGGGLELAASPRGVLQVTRPGANGAPATAIGRMYLALAGADGSKLETFSSQLAWTPSTPAGDPGDGGLFADGTILDATTGERVSAAVVLKPQGEAVKLSWEIGKKDLAEARPVRIVLEVPRARDVAPIEVASLSGATRTLDQIFAKAGASSIQVDQIIEIAFGTGAEQSSFRTAPLTLEAEKTGDGVRLELIAVPALPQKGSDVRVVAIDIAKASTLARGRVRELFDQAEAARRDGRLEDARQIYAKIAKDFSHETAVAARARREAALLAEKADRILDSVTGAASDAEELGLPELARAAHTWLDALTKAFPGAPQLSKAAAAVARADKKLETNSAAQKGSRARELVQRAMMHREAHRNRLARTIYEYVIATFPADDPSVKDARERLAAMPAEEGD
jgi:pSer/pThr/pTyr-binding forkhead associated (FHA) protein